MKKETWLNSENKALKLRNTKNEIILSKTQNDYEGPPKSKNSQVIREPVDAFSRFMPNLNLSSIMTS
jgi:hypothetical protein